MCCIILCAENHWLNICGQNYIKYEMSIIKNGVEMESMEWRLRGN